MNLREDRFTLTNNSVGCYELTGKTVQLPTKFHSTVERIKTDRERQRKKDRNSRYFAYKKRLLQDLKNETPIIRIILIIELLNNSIR